MKEYSDEELEKMSVKEINALSTRLLVFSFCQQSLLNIIDSAENGINPPDEEQGMSYLKDYENHLLFLKRVLRPKFHAMLEEVHAEAYREHAGRELSAMLHWDLDE